MEGEWMHYGGPTGAERVNVVHITPNTFDFLGVPALAGRVFGAVDAAPDSPKVAVLNHRAWRNLFGGDASMLGRTIALNGEPRTIVGIMPPRFEWNNADFWIPSALSRSMPNADRTQRWFQARLRRGVSLEEAEAQMNVIARRRAAAFPRDYPEGTRVQVITVIDWVVGRFRQTLYTLFAAVALLLLIACCNVANMLLARATTRGRELTIRAALGASRGRIARQLLMESALIAAGGAVVGFTLAMAGIRALARLLPRNGVAWEVQLRLEPEALWFALAFAVIATLIFGVLPALHGARGNLIVGINSGGRGAGDAPRQKVLRHGLVVAEVALSVILLLGAGILMRTFTSVVGVELGFDTRNLLMANVTFPPAALKDTDARVQFYRSFAERVQTLPGVRAAAIANGVPPVTGGRMIVEVPGVQLQQPQRAILHAASEEYAATLGLRLARGRFFSAGDVGAARRVAVINRTFAERFFNGADPLGAAIRFPAMTAVPDPAFQIVGVVEDIVNQGPRDPVAPHAFVPVSVPNPPFARIVVRTSGEPMAVFQGVRREAAALDGNVAVGQPLTLDAELLRIYYAHPRFNLVVLGIFASVGLALVVLGTYGVMAYTVTQETRQIAIRLALGGDRRHVLIMVLRTGLLLLAGGLVAGVATGLLTNRLLASVLWQVTPHDPATIAGTMALVIVVGAAACCIPAWRAMRVDPVVALRQD